MSLSVEDTQVGPETHQVPPPRQGSQAGHKERPPCNEPVRLHFQQQIPGAVQELQC